MSPSFDTTVIIIFWRVPSPRANPIQFTKMESLVGHACRMMFKVKRITYSTPYYMTFEIIYKNPNSCVSYHKPLDSLTDVYVVHPHVIGTLTRLHVIGTLLCHNHIQNKRHVYATFPTLVELGLDFRRKIQCPNLPSLM